MASPALPPPQPYSSLRRTSLGSLSLPADLRDGREDAHLPPTPPLHASAVSPLMAAGEPQSNHHLHHHALHQFQHDQGTQTMDNHAPPPLHRPPSGRRVPPLMPLVIPARRHSDTDWALGNTPATLEDASPVCGHQRRGTFGGCIPAPLTSMRPMINALLSTPRSAAKSFAFAPSPSNRRAPHEYRRIENHGLIGNMCTVALVATDACIDWFCYPSFDSPSVFGSILDSHQGGFYSIRASCQEPSAPSPSAFDTHGVLHSQEYIADTNVLATRLTSAHAAAVVRDFMPVPLHPSSINHATMTGKGWLVREIEVTKGQLWFEVECCPAFNYGMDDHETELLPNGARLLSPQLSLVLTSSQPRNWRLSRKVKGGAVLYICLEEGQKEWLVLREVVGHSNEAVDPAATESGPSPASALINEFLPHLTAHHDYEATPQQPSFLAAPEGRVDSESPMPAARSVSAPSGALPSTSPDAYMHTEDMQQPSVSMHICERLFAQTVDYWHRYVTQCTYQGRWRETVVRSVLALKLMTFTPTGAMVAAPTCSLPESIGGIRNWDYRFTWIRDSSFMLHAFMVLGYREEATAFMGWLENRLRASEIDPTRVDGGLQIMYGLRGETRLDEMELSHFAGYMDSRPVRIGNGAAHQLQLDIYGELLETMYLYDEAVQPLSAEMWRHVTLMVEYVCNHWMKPDAGIWEVRGGPQDFTYSKAMCWVALDRAIKIAERRSLPANLQRWGEVRHEIFSAIETRCWNPHKSAFVQSYDSEALDASCLFLPLVNFLPANEPRMVSTVEAILRCVTDGGLTSHDKVFRYDVETTDDGLNKDTEGTFAICTFWAAEALAMAGAFRSDLLQRSVRIFEGALRHGNHLGLFSEEMGLKGEALGNFPQGFSHLAIIRAAVYLNNVLSQQQAREEHDAFTHPLGMDEPSAAAAASLH